MPEMPYEDFLARVIDDGIAAAKADYSDRNKLAGALAGFEQCRDRYPHELATLLEEARRATAHAYADRECGYSGYWYTRCRELEIEWVCNVVSAALTFAVVPPGPITRTPIVPPTARAVMKAAEILGVKETVDAS
jgi:hypothetical protein